jgi:hypothetical protein
MMERKQETRPDDRPIVSVWWPEGSDYTVGDNGTTSIDVCWVGGEMGYVPWAEIWRGDILHARVRIGGAEGIMYAPPAAEEAKKRP